MPDRRKVRPTRPGVEVLDPATRRPIPRDGAVVDFDRRMPDGSRAATYWLRCQRDGDLEVMAVAPSPAGVMRRETRSAKAAEPKE